jgi:hypothetical protein
MMILVGRREYEADVGAGIRNAKWIVHYRNCRDLRE